MKQDNNSNIKYCADLEIRQAAKDLGSEELDLTAELRVGASIQMGDVRVSGELQHTNDVVGKSVDEFTLESLKAELTYNGIKTEVGHDSKPCISKSADEKSDISAFKDTQMGTPNTHNAFNDGAANENLWYICFDSLAYLPFDGRLLFVAEDGEKMQLIINADKKFEIDVLGEKSEVEASVVVRTQPNDSSESHIGLIAHANIYGFDVTGGLEFGDDKWAVNIEKEQKCTSWT